MKKIASIILILSIGLCSRPIYAWAPTEYEDTSCIDLSNLNEKGHISLPEKNGQKVCGCKTCTVDAVTYNKIGDYISILENEFDVQSKKADSLENRVKIDNIESILKDISNDIENRAFKNRNFLLVSTNYKPNDQTAIAQFAYKDGITSNYETDYFENINNEKIQPLLKKVSDYTSFMRGKEVPHIHNWGQDFKELGLALVIGIATVLSVPKLHEGYQKISEFFKNKDIKELVGKFNGLPENLKNSAKKKLICDFFNGEEVDFTEENLKKLSKKEIKELLKFIKALEENSI